MTIHDLLFAIFVYYVCLHGLHLLLVLIGATQFRLHSQGILFGEFQRIADSPLTLPVTVIIPAFNEGAIIAGTVLCALKLRYPEHEVIVVNDGSKDDTLQAMIDRFGLRRVDKVGQKRIETKKIRGVYESAEFPNLIVVDKENGRRADAINAAVCFSRYPLLCVIEADSVVEEDGLLRIARPFLRDSWIAAAGGSVQPANGLTVVDGKILGVELPRRMLALNQAVEYARSFLWTRIGLSTLDSMLCISGAFMLVKKDVFLAVGGMRSNAITDNIDFTIRLSRHVRDLNNKRREKVVYVPDAVCYTEVPETVREYASQRNRWQRGTLQALMQNIGMTFNPRYGLAGLFGMPFLLMFETLSAVVETAGYVLILAALAMGIATAGEVLLFIYLAFMLGTLISLAAVLLKETTRLRASSRGDLRRLIFAAFTDYLGFHQMHFLIRVAGTFDYFIRHRVDPGGGMQRTGSHLKRP